jgi:hypothetical protein
LKQRLFPAFRRQGANREPHSLVSRIIRHLAKPKLEGTLSLLKRLLGKNDPPKERVRICVECGMPIAKHKDWCSIYQIETKLRAKQNASETATS